MDATPPEGSSAVDVRRAEDEALPVESVADDPAWRLTAWALPVAAGATALLAAGQTLAGGLDRATGYPAALALLLLCVALMRDAQRRAATGRWVRSEVHEFALPLGPALVALIVLARGAAVTTCLPALLTLLSLAWEFVHAPSLAHVRRLFPYALPVVNGDAPAAPEANAGDEEIEGIVRDVLDRLPPDIAARMEGWSVEVREEMLPRPPNTIVYGCCFAGAHVIAIYRRPHLLSYRRGEPLRRAVTYTVLHEIAHALGLDEIGVRRLGWLADTAPRAADSADL